MGSASRGRRRGCRHGDAGDASFADHGGPAPAFPTAGAVRWAGTGLVKGLGGALDRDPTTTLRSPPHPDPPSTCFVTHPGPAANRPPSRSAPPGGGPSRPEEAL